MRKTCESDKQKNIRRNIGLNLIADIAMRILLEKQARKVS